MNAAYIPIIYFFYGLAFFCMGLAILLELVHATDAHLRHALRPLALFGLIHGIHEWIEMFEYFGVLPLPNQNPYILEGIRLALLSYSFLSLAAFGVFLIARKPLQQRISLLYPLALAAIWGFGVLILKNRYPLDELFGVVDVWTRYSLAIPAALIACAGLITQQHAFRTAGMAQFGRDSLWAAVAFAWYGVIGQLFTRSSPLPPSDVINQELFINTFGFPVQLVRATAALVAAIFVMRFLRSFEFETQRQITDLQEARLQEAERKDTLRSEMMRRIVEAQESERQRVARDLHDETGQSLTAIGLGLRSIERSIPQDVNKASLNIKQLENLVDRSMVELQRLIADLRPSHLDDLGLAAAVRWYANEVQNRVALRVTVDVKGMETSLLPETRMTIFRVIQEALTNVIKHAHATEANVILDYQEAYVHIKVVDNGDGFDPTRIRESGRTSWGVLGMNERANLLSGSFVINSIPGIGTALEMIIPYVLPDRKDLE